MADAAPTRQQKGKAAYGYVFDRSDGWAPLASGHEPSGKMGFAPGPCVDENGAHRDTRATNAHGPFHAFDFCPWPIAKGALPRGGEGGLTWCIAR